MNKINQLLNKFTLIISILLLSVSSYAQEMKPPSHSITSTDFQSKREPAEGGDIIKENSNSRQKKSLPVLTNPKRRYKLIRRQEAAVEEQVAKVATRSLIQQEPLPQTIYKVLLDEKNPFFVVFQIQATQ